MVVHLLSMEITPPPPEKPQKISESSTKFCSFPSGYLRLKTILLPSLVTNGSVKRMVNGIHTGSRIKTNTKPLNDDFYHTTIRRAWYLVYKQACNILFNLNLVDRSVHREAKEGHGKFRRFSVTYHRSFGDHALAGAPCFGNIVPEPAFNFTTSPFFYKAQLNSVPISSSTF